MSEHTDNAESRMKKCVDSLSKNFARVRTGRANPHILDAIKVDYYGMSTPITQLAGVKVPEAKVTCPSLAIALMNWAGTSLLVRTPRMMLPSGAHSVPPCTMFCALITMLPPAESGGVGMPFCAIVIAPDAPVDIRRNAVLLTG